MKTIIAGSRDATWEQVLDAVRACPWSRDITSVISGGARGADKAGEGWAALMGYEVTKVLPDWGTHGRKAGVIRNREMAKQADALIAVWDGQSKGTKNMIVVSENMNLKVFVWRTK